MSDSSSIEGGGVPEMLAKLRRGNQSGSPAWERFAMRLIVGHLLAYNIPGLDKVSHYVLHLIDVPCMAACTEVGYGQCQVEGLQIPAKGGLVRRPPY